MEKCNGFIDIISVLKFHIGLTLDADFPGPQCHVCLLPTASLSLTISNSSKIAHQHKTLSTQMLSHGKLTLFIHITACLN